VASTWGGVVQLVGGGRELRGGREEAGGGGRQEGRRALSALAKEAGEA